MPGDLLFKEKKYLETVFFVEKEIFWREEIPGSKKEALKTVAYHEIIFFWVREKIHIFLLSFPLLVKQELLILKRAKHSLFVFG